MIFFNSFVLYHSLQECKKKPRRYSMLQKLFSEQKTYLDYFFNALDLEKAQAILDAVGACQGTIFFSGVGKSGIIAEKLAVTLVSIGVKAMYLPPTNALHGDLGVLSSSDLWICLSKSGETKELLLLLPFVKQKAAKVMAWVCSKESSLYQKADIAMYLPLQKELCPFDLVPTTSATIQLLFGDLIAVALMQQRSFTLHDYAKNHPAGMIGKKISYRVEDLMLTGDKIPRCFEEDLLKNVLPVLSEKQCGCLIVIDQHHHVKGIFTDGDLRRALQRAKEPLLEASMSSLMTSSYIFIEKHHYLQEALARMQGLFNKKVNNLPVLDQGKLVGIIRIHDIVKN
jgi:arabinose-5-phosphate isomerase